MKVRFIADFDYRPSAAWQKMIVFRADPLLVVTVKRECGEEAVRLGRAVEVSEATEQGASNNDGAPAV